MARRPATLKDIADDVDVHVSTVSRALNPDTRHFIRPELANRIQEAATRLNYRPNAAAYSLRTRKTRIVGVIIPDIANPVFPPIIRGIEDMLHERGYLSILVNAQPRDPRYGQIVSALQSRGVDGLVVASVEREDRSLDALIEDGLAVVTVNRRADNPAIPSVIHDEDAGMRLILEHLRGLGHKRVVNVAPPQRISTGKARYDAFERHRRELGFDTSPDLVVFSEALDEAEGERCAALALDKLDRFTAVVASNDRLAVGVLSTMRQRGLVCPNDLSVTGFNDMPMVDRFDPPLTTVRVHQHEAGRKAAGLLLDLLSAKKGEAKPQHVVMPVEMVVRASTGKVSPKRRPK